MSARFARAIRRIVAEDDRSGVAEVVGIEGRQRVRLEGRGEDVLVAGNAIPEVGDLAAWLRVDEGTLVVGQYVPMLAPAPVGAMVPTAKIWEEVLVNTESSNLGVMFCHRDSSGRWWVKVRRFTPAYYAQESEDFLTTPWTYKGTGWGTSSESVDRASQIGDGDSIVEVGQASAGAKLAVRRITVNATLGSLSYGAYVTLPDLPAGTPLRSSVCKDSDGYYHVAAFAPWPYTTEPPEWQEAMWRSNSPNDISSWTRNHYLRHQRPPDNWQYPQLLALGADAVKFGYGKYTVNSTVYDDIVYRVCSGGSWGGEIQAPFDGDIVDGVGGPDDLHITWQDASGGLRWRRATALGAGLTFDAPETLLEDEFNAIGGLHRNYEEGSAPAVAWVTNWAKECRRFGLPPGDEAEDLERPDPLEYSIGNGALQAGGEWSSPAMDGFAAFLQYRTVYAARIVEAEA